MGKVNTEYYILNRFLEGGGELTKETYLSDRSKVTFKPDAYNRHFIARVILRNVLIQIHRKGDNESLKVVPVASSSYTS